MSLSVVAAIIECRGRFLCALMSLKETGLSWHSLSGIWHVERCDNVVMASGTMK